MVNKIGVHALVFEGSTSNEELSRLSEKAETLKYDVLELSLHDLDSLDQKFAAELFRAKSINVVCSRGLSFDADVSSEDTKIVENGSELLFSSLEAAANLGSKFLTGALYGALGKYERLASKKGKANAVSVLKSLSEEAHRLGVELGIEVCNRYETNFINTAEQARLLIDEIGADNVKLHLDTYHMNIEETDFRQPVLSSADYLGYVHIGESHRGYLGTGTINFEEFFGALQAVNYTGPITFESFSREVVAEGL